MLQLTNVALKISDRFFLKSVDFSVNQGEVVAIIGESGCGKTSLLKLIYGLFDLDEGTIFWKDQQITGPKENLIPGMPFIKYLSQDFDLMPFTSVEENIQKYLSRLQPELSAARTAELLEVVEMTAFAKAHVKTLSGGQKQRVALAQTLAKEPELLVLDEPFSHIDNFRKNKLRRSLFAYLKSKNITCIVATHDSTDVLSFTDKTIVMRDGKIIANGPTFVIYKNPATYYVASLFEDVNELPKVWFDSKASASEKLLLYPHQLSVHAQGIEVKVTDTFFMGGHFIVQSTHKDHTLLFVHPTKLAVGEIVIINLNI
jgi:ABC-type sulfate/molybdate transport systems ATPase subunit